MNGDVYILGAGASFESGAPLMNNFLDVAEDLLLKEAFSNEDSKEIQLVFDLISELQIVHSKAQLDLNNIESLFGAIEMGIILGRLTPKSKDIAKYKKALTTLISKTLIKSMRFPFAEIKEISNTPIFKSSESYNNFVELLKGDKIVTASVLTFNYDLGLDIAFHYNEIDIDYRLNEATNNFNLLKLYGSINWYTTNNKKIEYLSIKEVMSSYLMREEYQKRKFINGKEENFDINKYIDSINTNNTTKTVIIPPTWNKTDYHGQLTKVWKAAAEKLSNAQNIYIIGYSLPESDSFFRYLFALGTISKNRIRNIIVYNPENSGDTESRFRNLFGLSTERRFQYKPLTFSEAILDIAKTKDIKLATNKSQNHW
ncbi:hypothetical protein [Rufibacter immobilis]|uniref:hypothetical protein n=1 Tax=Rufibacter immobilis TaxID=1348778 RepID=UPI0035E63AE9